MASPPVRSRSHSSLGLAAPGNRHPMPTTAIGSRRADSAASRRARISLSAVAARSSWAVHVGGGGVAHDDSLSRRRSTAASSSQELKLQVVLGQRRRGFRPPVRPPPASRRRDAVEGDAHDRRRADQRADADGREVPYDRGWEVEAAGPLEPVAQLERHQGVEAHGLERLLAVDPVDADAQHRRQLGADAVLHGPAPKRSAGRAPPP